MEGTLLQVTAAAGVEFVYLGSASLPPASLFCSPNGLTAELGWVFTVSLLWVGTSLRGNSVVRGVETRVFFNRAVLQAGV